MRPFFETLTTPEVRRAFGLTLGITALATVVNTIFGIAIALVLVRQRFLGRALRTASLTCRLRFLRWSPG